MSKAFVTFSRILKGGLVNFSRNVWLAVAAIAVMVVALTVLLFALIANTTFNHTISTITDKIDVSVYLKDSVTEAQKQDLLTHLKSLENVKSVEYQSKEQVMQNYLEQNQGNKSLESAINTTGNPLPATITVKPHDLDKMGEIKTYLSEPEVRKLQSNEASYSGDRKEAIDNISHATNTLREIGIVMIVFFTIVSILVIFNTIRMAIFNRRDEIRIMRLLGAKTWYIRGPVVVENIIYGIIAGLISVFLIDVVFISSHSALQASSLGLLDISYADSFFRDKLAQLLTMQLMLGILVGALSSVIATRRYLKFKSRK